MCDRPIGLLGAFTRGAASEPPSRRRAPAQRRKACQTWLSAARIGELEAIDAHLAHSTASLCADLQQTGHRTARFYPRL